MSKVTLKRVREEEVPEVVPEGLQDGGHVYVACSNCRAGLMDIWRTRPYEQETWIVQANCPFCHDVSFQVKVQGGFHYGGYGVPKEDDEDDVIASTIVEHFETVGNIFQFTIKKASDDARPIRICD